MTGVSADVVSEAGWAVERVTGEHEGDLDGRIWKAWDVYLHGDLVFRSPSRALAEDGMRDWDRSGHGVSDDASGQTAASAESEVPRG